MVDPKGSANEEWRYRDYPGMGSGIPRGRGRCWRDKGTPAGEFVPGEKARAREPAGGVRRDVAIIGSYQPYCAGQRRRRPWRCIGGSQGRGRASLAAIAPICHLSDLGPDRSHGPIRRPFRGTETTAGSTSRHTSSGDDPWWGTRPRRPAGPQASHLLGPLAELPGPCIGRRDERWRPQQAPGRAGPGIRRGSRPRRSRRRTCPR